MMQEDSNGDFEIVDKKMTSLLVSDASYTSSSSSVLASVAPPAALPSFLASPIPATTGPSLVGSPAPHPTSGPFPPPGSTPVRPPGVMPIPPPGSVPMSTPGSTAMRPHGSTPIPSPGSTPIPPPGTTIPRQPMSPLPPGSSMRPGVPYSATSTSSQGPSPLLPATPSTSPPPGHLSPPPNQPGPVPTPQASFVSQPPAPTPVTSQPQPPVSRQNSVSLVTKGHSRHHSYPVYVPGNPIHNPPPPPTPPCLVVQQNEVVSGLHSKSQSNLYITPVAEDSHEQNYYPYPETCARLNLNPGGKSVGFVNMDTGNCSVGYSSMGSNVAYGHAYTRYSGGSLDTCASVDLGSPGVESPPGRGWFGWIRGTVSNVGSRVAERAKTSMDSMITTLDPQMKEFIHSGGDVDIVVASDKEVKVGAIREAFQSVFGKATISGVAAQAEGVAAQPVGFEAALKSAEERINFLRTSGRIHPQQPLIAVENFIVELTPDSWFDMGLLLLDDPGEDILLQTYTQVTPVPPHFVNEARNSTPDDYPFKSTGFATTVGQIASKHLQVHHTLWQETLAGVPRREMVILAARTLAGLYKSRVSQHH